jgi:hypothetical protein
LSSNLVGRQDKLFVKDNTSLLIFSRVLSSAASSKMSAINLYNKKHQLLLTHFKINAKEIKTCWSDRGSSPSGL